MAAIILVGVGAIIIALGVYSVNNGLSSAAVGSELREALRALQVWKK